MITATTTEYAGSTVGQVTVSGQSWETGIAIVSLVMIVLIFSVLFITIKNN